MTEEQIKAGLDAIVDAALTTIEAETAEIEVYVVVDGDGDYEVGITDDEASERYGETVSSSLPRHMIKMTITVPLPRTIEVTAAIPAKDDGSYELVIK